jgi:hypothetical protein
LGAAKKAGNMSQRADVGVIEEGEVSGVEVSIRL